MAGTDTNNTTKAILHIQELPNVPSDQVSSDEDKLIPIHYRIQVSCGSALSVISLTNPFDEGDESELRWLLEEYPESPFSLLRAKEVTKDLNWYAKSLATQLENAGVLQQLRRHATSRILEIQVEALEDEQAELHAIHWEALEDLKAWANPAVKFEAIQVVRIVQAPEGESKWKQENAAKDAFRILFVCARHSLDDAEDISSRLLMDPIFKIINEAKSRGRVTHAEILRPGSWDAFKTALEEHVPGYFSAVHFDCHGWISDGTAYLDFTRASGETHSVTASEIAKSLIRARVSVANLNACSSGTPTAGSASNLAFCFARSGIPTTIAMSYDILDDASSVFEEEFYRRWLLSRVNEASKKSIFDLLGKSHSKSADKPLTLDESVFRAVQKAREVMRERDSRGGAGGWQVSLPDHIVPVVYASKLKTHSKPNSSMLGLQAESNPSEVESASRRKMWINSIRSSTSSIPLRLVKEAADTKSETRPTTMDTRKFKKNDTMFSSLQPKGFRFKYIDPPILGRDRAIAEIEAAIVQPRRNVTFLEGRAGSGKSILVRHMCDWWLSTGYIQDFFYFDCRKYAMLEEAHDHPPCTAQIKDMMPLVEEFLFSSLFPEEVSTSIFRSKGTTKEQRQKTREKLRSGRYLLVFDNADFRMHEKDGLMTPMKSLTIGSSMMCRDSVIKSASAVTSLQSFIREIHNGNSFVMFAARYKRWYQDYLPDINVFSYSIPKLTLSACLAIGERTLQHLEAPAELCKYPGATEDFASLIDLLQHNPLAIEVVYSSIVRNDTKPNLAYIELCTDAMELLEKDASMAYAGAGRFVTELKSMANLDWNDGSDESRMPFSMFWVVDHNGYLPTGDGGHYWYFIIRFLYENWKNSFDTLGLTLGSNEEKIRRTILTPSTTEAFNELTELLGIPDRALALCKLMVDLGLMEVQNLDATHLSSGELLAQSKFLVHPLFSLVARNGCFGDSDVEHINGMRAWRRTIFLRYTLTRYLVLFSKQFSGGEKAVLDHAAGRSSDLDVFHSAATELLQTASKEFPSLITTLSWIAETPEELSATLKSIPKTLAGVVSPLGQLWLARQDIVFPFSQCLHEVFKRLVSYIYKNIGSPDVEMINFTIRQAIRLASMSGYRTEMPDASLYLRIARNLAELYRKTCGTNSNLPPGMELALLEADAMEAGRFLTSGDREQAFKLLNNLLTRPPPLGIPLKALSTYLHPTFMAWLTTLKIRKHTFPSQHVLLQMKEPLLNIIQKHEVCKPAEIDLFIEPIQSLLRRSLFDIVESVSLFPLPPRNKHFDARFIQLFGSIGGETVAVGMDTGISTVDPGGTSEAAETSFFKAFINQSNVAGSSGLAAMHMRIAQYFMGCGQWREVLRHLKAYSILPMPSEDRLNAGLRGQNALMASLCFSKIHAYEQARQHAFKAIEEAVEARDDGQSLVSALGAFAGIEGGRSRRYSVIPKLLVLRILDITYSNSPPHQNTNIASHFQLRNRKGDNLMLLDALTPQLYMPDAYEGLTTEQREEQIGRSFPGIKFWEDRLDHMIFLVSSDIQRKQEEARAGRVFWMDRDLEVELYTEAEQLLFAKEMPVAKHFADSGWALMVLFLFHLDTCHFLPLHCSSCHSPIRASSSPKSDPGSHLYRTVHQDSDSPSLGPSKAQPRPLKALLHSNSPRSPHSPSNSRSTAQYSTSVF